MYIDLLLLFVILLFGILGFVQGFIRQLLTVLMFISIILFAHPLALWLKSGSHWSWFERSPLIVNWGIAALFIALIFMMIHGVVVLARKRPFLSPMDRWLGLGLGCVKGVLVALVLTATYQILPEASQEKFEELHHDTKESMFMQASRSAMGWNWIPLTSDLREVQLDLQDDLRSAKKAPARQKPWRDSGVDYD